LKEVIHHYVFFRKQLDSISKQRRGIKWTNTEKKSGNNVLIEFAVIVTFLVLEIGPCKPVFGGYILI
jgi:hypothetical protein